MSLFSIVFLIIIFILTFAFLSLAIAGISFAPWVPTSKKDIKRIIEIAQIKDGQVVYDLGCGIGTVIFAITKQLPVQAVGIERAWPLFLICSARKNFYSLKGAARFEFGNLFKKDLSGADVIYIFGMPGKVMQKLKPKMEKELKKGTKIISYVFPVEGWKESGVDKINGRPSIYLYIKE